MKPRLQEKVAVVTGAASGIGRATALRFAKEGAHVHLADRDTDGLADAHQAVAALGRPAWTHLVDVTDPEQLENLAERVFDASGRVDVLMNNAGVAHAGTIESITLEQWDRVLKVNLYGVIHGIHAFLPRMLAQAQPSHIVNTASCLGLFAAPTVAPYCASKFAVVGLTESLAPELRLKGIYVHALCPGIIRTSIVARAPMGGAAHARHGEIQRFYERFGATPEEVAGDVLKAIHSRRVIQLSPSRQVLPLWLLKRISGTAQLGLARALFKRLLPG